MLYEKEIYVLVSASIINIFIFHWFVPSLGVSMGKNDQLIMVIERSILFNNEVDAFQGFKLADSNIDFENRILSNYSFKRRGDMESDKNYKQPISYCIIANLDKHKFFLYQRDSKNADPRITSNWSWGVGGHIEKIDIAPDANPLYTSMLREISEEVFIDGKILGTKLLGYVNDDSNDIGSVHFGLLYLLETDADIVRLNSNEIQKAEMVSPAKLELLCADETCGIDTWSRIAMTPLRESYSRTGFRK
jgi:predicted NUDIX family phosphoesterase